MAEALAPGEELVNEFLPLTSPAAEPSDTPQSTSEGRSPEYNAFCRLKHVLAEQLSNSFTSLKNDCLASALLTQEEMREKFGGHGVTPYQETSRLLDIVMMRIAYNPQLYHTFKNLSTLQRRAHKQLLEQLDTLLEADKNPQSQPAQDSSTDSDERSPLLPGQDHETVPPAPADSQSNRRWLKCKCLSLVVFIVAIILAGSATLATYYGIYDHREQAVIKSYFSDKWTVLLENVTGLLTDSITITQMLPPVKFDQYSVQTTYALVSTSELYRTTYQESDGYGERSRCALPEFQFMDPVPGTLFGGNPYYLLPGDSMRYDICFNTTGLDVPMFAYVAAFDQEDLYYSFSDLPSIAVGDATAAWKNITYIGTNKSECYSVTFTSRRHGYYFFSGFIDSAVNYTDQYVTYNFNLTSSYRIFNLDSPSAFTTLCSLYMYDSYYPQKPCSHELKFDLSSYSILGRTFLLPHYSRHSPWPIEYRVSHKFRCAFVGVVMAVIVVLAVVIISVLSLCVGLGVCDCRKK